MSEATTSRRPRASGCGGETCLGRCSSEARKQAGDWKGTLSREAKDHPGRTVAMALGAGFLLGGGLFSRLTARVLRLGVRLGVRAVLVPVVAQGIVALGEGLLSRNEGAHTDGPIAPPPADAAPPSSNSATSSRPA